MLRTVQRLHVSSATSYGLIFQRCTDMNRCCSHIVRISTLELSTGRTGTKHLLSCHATRHRPTMQHI